MKLFLNHRYFIGKCEREDRSSNLSNWKGNCWNPCSKPPFSTSVALFKPGTSHQSVSQTVCRQHTLPGNKLIFLLWLFPFSLVARVGRRGSTGINRWVRLIVVLLFDERWVSKHAGERRVSFVGITPIILASSPQQRTDKPRGIFLGNLPRRVDARKLESIFILRDLAQNPWKIRKPVNPQFENGFLLVFFRFCDSDSYFRHFSEVKPVQTSRASIGFWFSFIIDSLFLVGHFDSQWASLTHPKDAGWPTKENSRFESVCSLTRQPGWPGLGLPQPQAFL